MSTAPSVAAGLSLASVTAWRATASVSPSTGSMWTFTMASGLVSATCSISTPPSADNISKCFLAERSRVNEA